MPNKRNGDGGAGVQEGSEVRGEGGGNEGTEGTSKGAVGGEERESLQKLTS